MAQMSTSRRTLDTRAQTLRRTLKGLISDGIDVQELELDGLRIVVRASRPQGRSPETDGQTQTAVPSAASTTEAQAPARPIRSYREQARREFVDRIREMGDDR